MLRARRADEGDAGGSGALWISRAADKTLKTRYKQSDLYESRCLFPPALKRDLRNVDNKFHVDLHVSPGPSPDLIRYLKENADIKASLLLC